MGRHGSGKSNYRIAGWIWAAIAALIAIVAVVIAWTVVDNRNNDNLAAPECTGQKFDLTVWAAPEVENAGAKQLVDSYNESNPSAMDTCIHATVVSMPDNEALQRYREWTPDTPAANLPAAVWIPNDGPQMVRALGDTTTTIRNTKAPVINNDHPVLAPQLQGTPSPEIELRASDLLVDYGENDFPSVATDDGLNVTVENVGEFASKTAGDPNNANNANPVDPAATPNTLPATPDPSAPSPAAQGNTAPAKPQNVTFVLDTSGSMGLVEGNGTRMDNVKAPLTDAMRKVGSTGGSVGLWNYSSPLNPKTVNPYRDNVDITVRDNGDASAAALQRLTFGGATHTYSSIMAAYGSAAAGAEQFANEAKADNRQPLPNKVVLITDGPNDGGSASLEQAVAAIKARYAQTPVALEIVTIGDRVDRGALDQLAAAAGGKVFPAADSLQLAPALQSALAA